MGKVRIVNKTGVGRDTKVLTENGEEINAVTSIKFEEILPDNLVLATLKMFVEFDVVAETITYLDEEDEEEVE